VLQTLLRIISAVLTVKQILKNSELKARKRDKKTQLSRSPLISRRSALDCSAVQAEEAEEAEVLNDLLH